MKDVHQSLDIGAFQTLLRRDDAIVRDHRVHGVQVLPAVALLDVLHRAVALRGAAPRGIELRDTRFQAPVCVPEHADRRLVVRTEPNNGALDVLIGTRPVAESGGTDAADTPVAACVLAPIDAAAPAPAPSTDVAAVRDALAGPGCAALAAIYERGERLGIEHRDFMRAEGTVARLGDRLVAHLSLRDAAAARSADFLLHPTLLNAALALATIGLDDLDGVYLPVGVGRFFAHDRATDAVYVESVAARVPGEDAIEAGVRLYDGDGRLIAEFERLLARRARQEDLRRALDPPAAAPAGVEVPRTPAVAAAPAPARAPAVRRARTPLDIAVVGMSGRYPDAPDLEQFWRNLEAGHDAIREVPSERWRPDEYPSGGRRVSRFGGFLADVDMFDARFFRIPPSTAAALDPQERLFLQTAYAAVENAGYQPDDFSAPDANRIGVFVGATWSDYRLLGVDATRSGEAIAMTSTLSSIANRVSYFFNFVGPSLAVDTACSSSLTALHLACRSIRDGECDGAVVGGVNLLLHPDKYLLLSSLNMTSSDGRCRAFGDGGDGYVPGEGVGALLLKPLDRARADGDTIHGVVLGTAVNHGGRSAGFTVPHPVAQAGAIAGALEQAQVDPETIGYVEAHGTGTALGDPVEIQGLNRAFSGRSSPCALGSVKSNVGHLEAAAGVSAITRTLLQFRHDRIAPSLHSQALNPEIDFENSPFYVPQEAADWPPVPDRELQPPHRAGVSSFGAGGANAHIVLEAPTERALAEDPAEPEIVILSARSEERLRELAGRIAGHLRATERPGLRDIARTLQVGRPAMEVRLALVAASPSSAAELLDGYLRGERDHVLLGTAAGSGDPTELIERYRRGDLDGAARAWVEGATPEWPALNGGPRRRLPLPGYPFERRRFWIEVAQPSASPVSDVPATTKEPVMPPSDHAAAVRRTFEASVPRTDEELERCLGPLGRYAAVVVLQRFREMGYADRGGSAAQLREQMGVVAGFAPFFDACLAVLERQGCIGPDRAIVRAAAQAGEAARLRAELERLPESAPYLRLLDVCVDAYPRTLRGAGTATEVLFPGSSLELMTGLYRGNRVYDFYSDLAARFVTCAAVERARSVQRPVRILEVGAGTGGTSQVVLEALAEAGADVEYHYTDLGPSFVAHGRTQFGPRFPFAHFGVLDVEKDAEPQGFEAGSWDIVLAVGAVHAVADIDETLTRIRRLLAPSGLLVLGEAVDSHDVMAVTIGLLDGWHLYGDPERRIANSPLLTVDGWQAAIERVGLHDFAAYGPGLTADPAPTHRLIVAAGDGAVERAPEAPVDAGAAAPAAPAAAPAAAPVAQQLAAAAVDADADAEAVQALEGAIAQIIADALGVGRDEIRPSLSFAEYGIDSILGVDMVDQINGRFGLDLKTTVIFDAPSVRALAEHTFAQGARAAAPEAGAAPAARATTVVSQPRDSGEIAVIGMSGRFPDAGDYRELWRNLLAEHDAVTEVPTERWDVADYYQPWPPAAGKTYSKWGGYLHDVDRFDPLFFSIVPAEADFMDPQQRLFLEESWKALEDAGLDATALRGARCGVFAGSPAPDYMSLIRERGLLGSPHVFTGNATSILPARVAYHLDFTGPCCGVDTACSSSLVALHHACQSLTAGECELALAGGAAVFTTPEIHQLASSLGMLSPAGRCKPFDESADGFVMAEGVGVVVLKTLERARADGDPIHGVIKGIGVNQDGRTNGITAPSARSQTALELEVYERCGIDPASIGYVETHGTGTRLGDPIEIEALTAAFRRHTDRSGFVPIGSIKSNVGHASHAAGVAGLLKVLLTLRERRIPPSLHFDTPNRMIAFEETPFFVNTQVREWSEGPRRAALSSFGFSGTNCHVVIEEHVDTRPPTRARSPRALVPLSARSAESVRHGARALERHLAERPHLALHDVAATLQLGRVDFEHRLAIIAGSVDELRDQLARAASGSQVPAHDAYLGDVDPDAKPAPPIRLTPDADLEATAQAWAAGASFDFRGLYDDGRARRVNLPGYTFARDVCWLPDAAQPVAEAASDSRPAEQGARPVVAASPEQVRRQVVGAAAEQLGLAEDEIDPTIASDDLGFDVVSRAGLVERLNAELGVDLPIDAFPVRASLAQLAERLASPQWTGSGAEPAPLRSSAVPDQVVPDPVAADHVAAEPVDGDPLVGAAVLVSHAEEYLKRLLAAESRLPLERIRTTAPLQDYGIESVLISRLNDRLRDAFGALPTTLFFEYQTIRGVAEYLAGTHPGKLRAVTGDARAEWPAEGPPAPVAQARAGLPDRTPASTKEIAVIGMAGRYPMAADNDELWSNLVAGRDCIVEIPPDRWDHAPYLSEDRDEPGATYARWGGFIDDVDKFDARFFNISPKDAESMDPQQRVFLEAAWAALEDGGYTPGRIRESAARRGRRDAGVFAGVTYGEYQLLVDIPIAGYWAVANRVSYHMGFNGPSLAVDTACSSSLTALHLACESLARGECAYAVAGGVNVSIHPGKYLLLGYGRWASSDGRCRAFGAGGDGYVPSEGVATLLLKPLEDARADGDRVYGVIRGSTINHGGRTNGFTVPNPHGQAELVFDALTEAGVDARSVSYVEAHGTGTALGDPIEIAALTKAFRRFTDGRDFCAIGSAKSGIGHLEAAAGVVGVVKTLLQLEHETIVPTLHADPPNPGIDFQSSPFRVAHESVPWPRRPEGPPRVAAVSSFGAGGANAHVIVQEEARARPEPAVPGPQLVLLSGRRPDRLREQARNLVTFLASERGAGASLADVAWTLMVGREDFEHRLALVVREHDDLIERLEGFLDGRTGDDVRAGQVAAHQDAQDGASEADRQYARALLAGGQLTRLAELWTRGWEIDWESLHGQRHGQIVSLPTYPFARDRYWIVPEDFRRNGAAHPPVAALPDVVEFADAPAQEPVGSPAQEPVDAAAASTFRDDLEAKIMAIFSDLTKHPVDELDVHADFLDFGFDSVVAVRMLNRLMKLYAVRIPGAVIEEHSTIRSFADHLLAAGLIVDQNAVATADSGDAAGASSAMAPVLSAPAREPRRFTRETALPIDSILITGVTGVLGGKLLYDLLSLTSAHVTCLVRGEDVAQARERIRYFFGVYDAEGELSEAFDRRVTPVLGDVSREGMGLDSVTTAALAEQIDLTIHAAARTTLVGFYDALAPTNVEGTRRAIDFALQTRHRYMVYVSSFSALGDWLLANNRPFTERELELGQGYDHLPYQETKYHAEKLIRAASDEGLVWNIFRPGNIMGDARTGRYPFAEVTVKGVYYDIFKTVAETGISMRSSINWDISPVDYVSAGILHLALRRPAYRETYHLLNPDIRSLYEVLEHVREFGYDVQAVSIDEFHRLAAEGLFRRADTGERYESQTLEMVKYGIEIWGREHYEASSRADCTYTQKILGAAGIACPPVAEIVPRYLEHCIEAGYIEAPHATTAAAAGRNGRARGHR
jgi:thioester reductase-like protein